MKASPPAAVQPLAYTFKTFYETVVPMSRAKANQLVASGELEAFVINNRRYVLIAKARAFVKRKARAGGAVPSEVSAAKSRAGRRGRAIQLQQAADSEAA